jgi:hypothetical protein
MDGCYLFKGIIKYLFLKYVHADRPQGIFLIKEDRVLLYVSMLYVSREIAVRACIMVEKTCLLLTLHII